MAFGYALDDNHRLFLLVLHVLTDLTWPAIGRAYCAQFPVPYCHPSSSDCRTQWSRKIRGTRPCLALQVGQILPPHEDAQVRAYLQAHGLQHLNPLGRAYLNAGPAQATQAITQAPAPTGFAPPAPIAATTTTTPQTTTAQQPQISMHHQAAAVPGVVSQQMPGATTAPPSNNEQNFSTSVPYDFEEEFVFPGGFTYQGGYWPQAQQDQEQTEENPQGQWGGFNYPSP